MGSRLVAAGSLDLLSSAAVPITDDVKWRYALTIAVIVKCPRAPKIPKPDAKCHLLRWIRLIRELSSIYLIAGELTMWSGLAVGLKAQRSKSTASPAPSVSRSLSSCFGFADLKPAQRSSAVSRRSWKRGGGPPEEQEAESVDHETMNK